MTDMNMYDTTMSIPAARPLDIDDEAAWQAVQARDPAYDGRFVTGVVSTGIYCRPSCPARHPRRENVRFYRSGEEAAADGLRPCLRCRPDEVSRDKTAIEHALQLLREADEPLSLTELARAVGYSPHHFHRLFKRATGVTPAAFVRASRAQRLEASLDENGRITDAIYDSGYSGPGRFYADAKERLGMTPSAWKDGGRGETIRWTIAQSSLGPLLVAATGKGICRLTFDEGEDALRRRFPNARIDRGGEELERLAARAVAAVEAPGQSHDLPLDVRGTAFQEAVWHELSRIPPGETASYAALAARTGKPGATRAVGTACGANPVAILIPCHRALRSDGTLGGYAGGLERKVELLQREGVSSSQQLKLPVE
jgi:AraC family transcriptional regulator of adaptative response/methylated-DNA-[protein]-cysteine methyltransferase